MEEQKEEVKGKPSLLDQLLLDSDSDEETESAFGPEEVVEVKKSQGKQK